MPMQGSRADGTVSTVRKGADDDQRFAGLMRAAQDGDTSAYGRLLADLTPLLRRVIRRRQPALQWHDAEDLVQDILLALHTARATYDPERPFLPWLMAIARNRMADGARAYARRSANEVTVEHMPETRPDADMSETAEAVGGPLALRQAMRTLPAGQREAIRLLKVQGLSLNEASAATGMSVAALKVAVHRGVKRLRETLA